MKITLTPGIEYRVRISTEPLEFEDEPAYGLWVERERTIWIDQRVPVDRRRQVLVHELHHAWGHHVGIPDAGEDPEAAANNAVAFAEVVRQIRQFDLEHLTVENIVDHSSTVLVPALPIGAECARCGQRFSAQQIGEDTIRRHGKSDRPVIDRGVYCDHCGHVQLWTEAATGAGEPTGMVLGKPRFLRGPQMNEWLWNHADSAGVFVN